MRRLQSSSYLETEFLEEEFESGVLELGGVVQVELLVSLLEVALQVLSESVSSVLLAEDILGLGVLLLVLLLSEALKLGDDRVDSEFSVDVVSGWHNVVDVYVLDERLDLDSPGDSLLRQVLVDSSWVSVNTGDEAVWVLATGSGGLANTEDDGLSSGISAAQENNDSTDLEDLSR